MAAKRLLLAEDEPNIVTPLQFLLTREGFAIDVCETGPKALATALENAPDVMVLDVMLPGMDGFEILRQLRADPRGAAIPVLMLTAKGQREDREKALQTGADMFITKPFGNAELVDAVLELAQGRTGAHG